MEGSISPALARCSSLLRRRFSRRCRTFRRCRAAEFAAFARGGAVYFAAAAGAAFLAAVGFGIHRRPCAPLGFFLAHAALLVTLFDIARHTLLLVGVARFVAAR